MDHGYEATGQPPRLTRNDDVWETLVRWRAGRRAFVLATVIETRGFTPRKNGARMLVAASEMCGTIGGGAIELEVLAEARRLIATGGTAVVKRHLTQELGMCCGGAMTVHLERIELAPPLVVFGAGHVAKPLAAIAAGCGFEVTVVDERTEWACAERFPTASLEVRDAEAFARGLTLGGDEFVVVATHDHALDQKIVQHLLPRRPAFLGMIGSVAKQRKFALRLRARGFGAADIARLRSPLGIPIGGHTPEEIAVSVVAELIAVRHGAPPVPGWTPREPESRDAVTFAAESAVSAPDPTPVPGATGDEQ